MFAFLNLLRKPLRGDTSLAAFNSEEPPPVVIDFVAFSPITAIVKSDELSIGKRVFLFFNKTIPSVATL